MREVAVFHNPPEKLSCSVCWQDFSRDSELEDHVRHVHPDRICAPSELFRQARLASGKA